ncbi:MAG TPA: hypothetical protein VGK44_01360 [Casimicrobiaceae bacterium]|jgi:hypothetical protein
MDLDFFWHQQGGDQPAVGPVRIQGGADPLKTEALVKGDAANPLTTVLLGDPVKPLSTLVLGDPAKPVTALIEGDPAKPVTTLILGDPNRPLTTLLEGDPNKPITFSIKDIPKIDLSAELGIKPTRVHNPLYYKFCISLFGMDIVTFALCGESMTIIEPYVPHKSEVCL